MVTATKTVDVRFRSVGDALRLIGQALGEIGANIGFPYNDELAFVVEGLAEKMAPLVYAQVLERIGVGFAGEEIQIRLDYYPEPDQEDDLDVSFLKMVPIQADRLELGIVVTEEECASYLGAEKLASLSTANIEVTLVCVDKQTAEQAAEYSSEGGEDNGNES